jgi:glycosyltransferase involved in cell wall biosynthesis
VRPALIHVSSGHRGFETALVALALREHIRRPVVYEVRSFFEATWSPDPARAERGELYRLRHAAEARVMSTADHVITISEAMRDEIVARGLDPDRVTVIPNGVDVEAFSPRDADPALRSRYGLGDAFVFGYVSNLDHPRENQELLIAATRRLVDRGRRVRCLLVGDGRRRPRLEQLARDKGVARQVVFTGAVPHDEVAAHYALLHAFVVPRQDEHASRTVTPLKPYEAMAVGLPLVVADLPALREIVAPDSRGLAFPPGDEIALADSLERLIDSQDLGPELGRAGREWVVQERTWDRNGPRYDAVYRGVLERWAAGPAREA